MTKERILKKNCIQWKLDNYEYVKFFCFPHLAMRNGSTLYISTGGDDCFLTVHNTDYLVKDGGILMSFEKEFFEINHEVIDG